MPDRTASILAIALARAPEWVRHELASVEPQTRQRAEETLAAMLAAALQGSGEPDSGNAEAEDRASA